MRILITGSEGTLGRKLKQELRRRNHLVFGCDLQHSSDKFVMRADVAEHRQLQKVFGEARPELVYHLAAEFGRMNGQEYYEQLWKSNCIGTRNVIDLCQREQALMAFASSSEAYGAADAYAPPDEDFQEDWLERYVPSFHNEYALTKYTNEKQIQMAVKNERLKSVVFRFFNAYGPGERYSPYRSVICLFIYKLLTGQPITVYRNYYRVCMWVGDWARTVANLADNTELRGTYNIGGTEYISVEQLLNKILALIGPTTSQITFLEAEKANVVSKKPDITKAIRDLDHRPITTLDEGLPQTIEWMRKEYGL